MNTRMVKGEPFPPISAAQPLIFAWPSSIRLIPSETPLTSGDGRSPASLAAANKLERPMTDARASAAVRMPGSSTACITRSLSH